MNLISSSSDNEHVTMPSVMSSKKGGGGASTSLMGYHHNNNNNISHSRGEQRGLIMRHEEAVVHALHLLTCKDVTKTTTSMMATTQ